MVVCLSNLFILLLMNNPIHASLTKSSFLYVIIAWLSTACSYANSADYCYVPLAGASVCPKISDLKYNSNNSTWTTDDDWKSTANSFTTEITTFIGAQWKGVQMGHLLCIYQGPRKNEFPVSMHKNIIVQSPNSLLDNLNPKGAQYKTPWSISENKTLITMDCYSSNNSPCDCPWIQFQEKEQSVSDVIESIQKPTVYPPWAL